MNENEKSSLAFAATEFLIINQLSLLRLTGDNSDIVTLSIPTVNGITEEDLLKILKSKFSFQDADFDYIKMPSANGTTIIHIKK